MTEQKKPWQIRFLILNQAILAIGMLLYSIYSLFISSQEGTGMTHAMHYTTHSPEIMFFIYNIPHGISIFLIFVSWFWLRKGEKKGVILAFYMHAIFVLGILMSFIPFVSRISFLYPYTLTWLGYFTGSFYSIFLIGYPLFLFYILWFCYKSPVFSYIKPIAPIVLTGLSIVAVLYILIPVIGFSKQLNWLADQPIIFVFLGTALLLLVTSLLYYEVRNSLLWISLIPIITSFILGGGYFNMVGATGMNPTIIFYFNTVFLFVVLLMLGERKNISGAFIS